MQDTPEKEYYEFEDIKTQEKQKVEGNTSLEKPIYDIFTIKSYQFIQIYNNKILPLLTSAQEEGRSEQEGVGLTKFVCVIIILGFSCFDILLWVASFTEKQAENRIVALIFAILFLIPLVFAPLMLSMIRKVDRYVFKETFFPFFNLDYSRYTYVERNANKAHIYRVPLSETISKAMGKMAISSLKYTPDESLKIKYKGKKLEFLELNGSSSSESCLIVSYFIDKNFKGETIVKSVYENSRPSFSSKQKVNLEDPIFNENFNIFADDQVEARYLLTTAFMERLLTFQRKHKCAVSVLFDNNISRDSNIFLSLTFGKDFFELPKGEKWIKDPSYFYNICQEIKEIAQILDALKEELKLEQDIGM